MTRARDVSKIFTTAASISDLDSRIFISSASPSSGNTNGRIWIDTTTASAPIISVLGTSTWRQPYLGRFFATGGVITESNGYKIHTFTSTSSLVVIGQKLIEYLVVGGGGAGGPSGAGGGGGGAGGFRTGTFTALNGSYSVVIGGGGPSISANGYNSTINNGIASSFGEISSAGGGGGSGNNTPGASGGSGGGGNGGYISAGGSGNNPSTSPVQGYAGGTAISYSGGAQYSAGGGGGAGGVGENGSTSRGGNGGIGAISSITGSQQYYAAGGGGGIYTDLIPAGTGGLGGGGNGATDSVKNGTNGSTNSGSGGGGAGGNGVHTTGAGGSGIVIIRYLI
jgi:hypothetical protein